jgi:hypothetical protein
MPTTTTTTTTTTKQSLEPVELRSRLINISKKMLPMLRQIFEFFKFPCKLAFEV